MHYVRGTWRHHFASSFSTVTSKGTTTTSAKTYMQELASAVRGSSPTIGSENALQW